jgi:hypothetical protein
MISSPIERTSSAITFALGLAHRAPCPPVLSQLYFFWGGGVCVVMFAHNNSGIAYQNRNARPETVVFQNTQQPTVLTNDSLGSAFIVAAPGVQLAGHTSPCSSVNYRQQHKAAACRTPQVSQRHHSCSSIALTQTR